MPAIFYVITPDSTAVEAFRGLRRQFPQALLVPMHNEIFGPAQHRAKYELFGSVALARLPALAPTLRPCIETPPFSFADMTALPSLRKEQLQEWLRLAYREFRELDLRILLTDVQSVISVPSWRMHAMYWGITLQRRNRGCAVRLLQPGAP